MANYTDDDVQWITVHPNGKEEKPGIHIAINGAGKVVKGPEKVKDKLNDAGGLNGAKSVPLDTLKQQKGEGENNSTEDPFAFNDPLSDHDFDDVFGDGGNETGFTDPMSDHDFGDILDEPKEDENAQKITEAQIDKFSHQMAYNTEGVEAVKKVVTEHPDLFETAWSDPTTLGIKGGHGQEVFDLIEAEKAKASGTANAPKFTDEQISSYAKVHASNANNEVDEKQFELWKKYVSEHPDEFHFDLNGGIAYNNGWSNLVKIANKIKDEASGDGFTDEEIETIKKVLGDECWFDSKVNKVITAIKAGKSLGEKTNGYVLEDLKQHIDKNLYYKVVKALCDGTTENQGFTEAKIKDSFVDTKGMNNPHHPPKSPLPQAPKAVPVSEELTADGVPFPKDTAALGGLTKVKSLGGASGANATLYKDANGNMFVMKRFSAADKAGQQRIKEECDADAYYLSGGANVPHFKLYGDEKTGYTKLSQYIPGTKTLGSVWGSADDALKAKIKEGLRKNFALDVMAGAWDVLGSGGDNILVDKDGNVWRCDNGGAFNRRAQGGEKSMEEWGNGHIDDLWTMRGLSANLDGTTVPDGTGKKDYFGDITTHQLLSDIASRDWSKMIAHLPDATRAVMEKRIANAKEYHSVCDNIVTEGKYGDGRHAEDITLYYHSINKSGAMTMCDGNDVSYGDYGLCRGTNTKYPMPTLGDFFEMPRPKFSDFFKLKEPKIDDIISAPEPKLEDFANAQEPTLASYMPSVDVSEVANKLKAAGISINHHTSKMVHKSGGPLVANGSADGKPSEESVNAALALKPSLEAVSKGTDANAKAAKKALAYIAVIEKQQQAGWPLMEEPIPNSPSVSVDLSTPESKAAAKAKFEADHKKWESDVANAKQGFEEAHKAWENKTNAEAAQQALSAKKAEWEKEKAKQTAKYEAAVSSWLSQKNAAQKKCDAAVTTWKKKHPTAKPYKNLTDAFTKFCKANGIDSSAFWEMAAGQGGGSDSPGSARMKFIEAIAMGAKLPSAPFDEEKYNNAIAQAKTPAEKKKIQKSKSAASKKYIEDFCAQVPGFSPHNALNSLEALSEFASNPEELKRYTDSYLAMKALSQMILRKTNIDGLIKSKDGKRIRLVRIEDASTLSKYQVHPGEVCTYPVGAHESIGSFHTYGLAYVKRAVVFDLPVSRISSMYFMTPSGTNGTHMYLGDVENEFGFNGVGINSVMVSDEYVSNHTDSKPIIEKVQSLLDQAYGKQVPVKKAAA